MPAMAVFCHCIRRISPKVVSAFCFSNSGGSKLCMRYYTSGNARSQSAAPNQRTLKLILAAAGLGFGLAASSSIALASSENLQKNEPQTSTSEPVISPSPGDTVGPVVTKSGKVLNKIKIFIGYDPREDLAYEVCRYSILKHATMPVEIIPIKQPDLRKTGLYWRNRDKTESTEFSFTRFLTPFLAGFEGWALFIDCDFLYTADIRELAEFIDDKYAIMCVKHDYTPKNATKMDGVPQTVYPRKNWSSMVLYNCSHPKNRVLTPSVVNSQSGAFLHRFTWLDNDDIGSIPFVWNFLVGHNEVDDENRFPRAIHYTSGGPWFEAWKDCEFADLWLKERDEYIRTQKIQRVIQDELIRLMDNRIAERSGEIESKVVDLESKVKEVDALKKLLAFYLKEKVFAPSANSLKEPPVEA
uniref:Glycosyltransferase n=1 Tax=Picea sitchensis TaxID=3332 RepID=B8LMR9_PICSI|nr:unknown [Picea sitchensis]